MPPKKSPSTTPPSKSPTTSSVTPPPPPPPPPAYPHGYAAADPTWSAPKCVTQSSDLARPGYSAKDASEYLDTPDVLAQKVKQLVAMMTNAQRFAVYTGAGLSTAAGIGDYASKASGSIVGKEGGSNRLSLQPTFSHRALAALEKKGHLKFWLQQNHDGLAQKAGFPLKRLNEIHGTWFDPRKNPVVLMDGQLRKDLLEWMMHETARCDLCLAIGTSLCGMSADVLAEQTAKRHKEQRLGFGLVVLNLQQTPYDQHCALRIFAKADDVFRLVQKEMKLKIDSQTYDAMAPPMALDKLRKEREAEWKKEAEEEKLRAMQAEMQQQLEAKAAAAKKPSENDDDAA